MTINLFVPDNYNLQLSFRFSFAIFGPDNMWKPCSTSVKFLLSNEYFNIRVINVFPREQSKSIHFFRDEILIETIDLAFT